MPAGTAVGEPIPDEASAITRAEELTALEEPIVVVRVEQGLAGGLVSPLPPGGLYPNEQEAAREQAKRQRPAWGVTLVGRHRLECGDADKCPFIQARHQLAIDRETGELLLQVFADVGAGQT